MHFDGTILCNVDGLSAQRTVSDVDTTYLLFHRRKYITQTSESFGVISCFDNGNVDLDEQRRKQVLGQL
jgi:hypothetical protein